MNLGHHLRSLPSIFDNCSRISFEIDFNPELLYSKFEIDDKTIIVDVWCVRTESEREPNYKM